MDLNDDLMQSYEDLNNYGERVYGSIGYVSIVISLFTISL